MPFGSFCPDCTWPSLKICKFVWVGGSGGFSTEIHPYPQVWPFQGVKNSLGKCKQSREPLGALTGQKKTRQQELGYEYIVQYNLVF